MARVHATGWTLAVALAACQTEAKPLTESVVRILFDEFTTKHRPQQYGSEEDRESRFEIFNKNVQQIEMVNSQNLSYTLTINQFTDMSPLEFSRSHGFKKPKEGSQWKGAGVLGKHRAIPSLVAPQSVDWVSRGAVTPVKNQGQCGSCWSFSTTGALEGAFQIATGRLVSLSEQQLVDCDPEDSGCSGGIPEEGLQFEQKQGDICTEESYPYTARDGSCQANGCSAGFHGSDIKGIREVDASEDALTQAVAGRPISIAIDAGPFQNYNGGVLSDCGGRGLDHAVLLVGYDGESWKVKNSWGPSWGESGYIRMMRQGANCLGLQNQAVYAIVAGSPSPSPSPTPSPSPSPSPNCKPSSLSFCCSKGTPCDCSRGSGAAGQCHWWSYEFCCKTGTPCHCASPSPSPSPTPTPTPTPVPSPSPAPGPGTSCEWNSDCPPGQECYYPNESASSGICSSSPPFLNSGHRHGHDITV